MSLFVIVVVPPPPPPSLLCDLGTALLSMTSTWLDYNY